MITRVDSAMCMVPAGPRMLCVTTVYEYFFDLSVWISFFYDRLSSGMNCAVYTLDTITVLWCCISMAMAYSMLNLTIAAICSARAGDINLQLNNFERPYASSFSSNSPAAAAAAAAVAAAAAAAAEAPSAAA
jgi:hypothetical protein